MCSRNMPRGTPRPDGKMVGQPKLGLPKEACVRQVSLTIPELGLIAGTRAALGAGIALLLSERLPPEQRRAVGWTLLAVGIVSTVPLVADVVGKTRGASKTD